MITKIQSFTDLITNSSSTVFVMTKDTAEYYQNLPGTGDCITIEPITFDWLIDNHWEVEMVCQFLDVSPAEVTTRYEGKYWDGWDDPDPEAWQTFLELHREKIEEVFKDLYWVDIEDHFEDAYEVIEEAGSDAEWSDYRH